MECAFKGANTKTCFANARCNGMNDLIISIGGSQKFAQNFSNYVLKRGLKESIENKSRDSATTFQQITIKIICKIIKPFTRILCPDIYKIEHQIRDIRNNVDNLENKGSIYDPMEYFSTVGKGYGLLFKYAAVGIHSSLNIRNIFQNIGNDLGTLISLRDSYKDLKKDVIERKFNPFKTWPYDKIKDYYKEVSKILIDRIELNKKSLNIELSFRDSKKCALDQSKLMNIINTKLMADFGWSPNNNGYNLEAPERSHRRIHPFFKIIFGLIAAIAGLFGFFKLLDLFGALHFSCCECDNCCNCDNCCDNCCDDCACCTNGECTCCTCNDSCSNCCNSNCNC